MDPTLENNCKLTEEEGPIKSEVEVTGDQETEESVESSDEETGESSGENTSGDISGEESGDETGEASGNESDEASGDETGEASDDETQKPNEDISAEESDDESDEGPGEENDNTIEDVSADEDGEDSETPSAQSHPEPDMSVVNNNSGMEEVDVSDGQKPGQKSDRLSEEITSQQSMEESVMINRQSPPSLNQQDDIRDSRDSSDSEKPDVEIVETTNPSDQLSREDQDIIDVLIPFDYQKYTDTHPTLVSYLKDRNLINEIARNIFGNTSLSNWLEACYQQKRKLAAAELLLEKITTGVENIVINAENQIKIPSIAGLVRSEGNYQFIILLGHNPHNISFYPLEDWIKKGGHLDLEPYEKATFFFFRLTEYEKEQIGLMINEPWMEKLLQDS